MGQRPTKPIKLELVPGDHIYRSMKGVAALYHHGIYVGDGMVIHFLGPQKMDSSPPVCQKCGFQRDSKGGLKKTCLDCFLDGEALLIMEYGPSFFPFQPSIPFLPYPPPFSAKPRGEVVDAANNIFNNNSFGNYDLLKNNCEHFAVYCKTGVAVCMQLIALATALQPGPTLLNPRFDYI